MRKLFFVFICFQIVALAERGGRVREFLRSPFQRGRVQRTQQNRNYNPIVNSRNERTIAINGMAVPANAIGYRISNGQISWLFQVGSQSPSIQGGGSTPSQLGSASPQTHSGAAPSAPREQRTPRPVESGEDKLPRASARPAPSAEELRRGGDTPSQEGKKSSSDLFPAGANGNPGFPYKVKGPGFSEKCQATLISNDKGLCMAATASHCLYDGVKRSTEKGFDKTKLEAGKCDSTVKQKGFLWGKGQIETADFGSVEATFFVNPEYYSGTKSEDSAVFTFPCAAQTSVKTIPVSLDPLKNGEQVLYGKVMAGKEGLYEGKVYREPGTVKINRRAVGEAQESVNQPSDVAIQQGDSGGGLYRKNENGDLELVGVLSTGDDITKNRPLGSYATNRSLQFIKCIQKALSQS